MEDHPPGSDSGAEDQSDNDGDAAKPVMADREYSSKRNGRVRQVRNLVIGC